MTPPERSTATIADAWMRAAFQPALVSVIMPTYNRARLMVESADSVFQQTYRPIELLIVDDGSTDDTEATVEAWLRTRRGDDQFTVRRFRQANSGAPSARNRGLAESRGEFIQFLDSDDLLHPEKLQRQVGLLISNPDVDYVYSEAGMFETVPNWNAPPCFGRATRALLSDHVGKSTLNSICGVYRRRLCHNIGKWNEDLLKWQDWEYNVRMLASEPRCRHLAGVYCLARRHGQGRIADLSETQEGLDAMARAVASAERTLSECGLLFRSDLADLSRALAARYLLITMEAVRHGYPAMAREAAHAGLQYGPDLRRRLRFKLLRALALLPAAWGSRCGDLLLKTYTKACSLRQWN